MKRLLLPLLAVVAILQGCATTTPATSVHQPMSVRPPERETKSAIVGGSIFSASLAQRGLFEDRRARLAGDTLTINLIERTQAAKNAGTSTSRSTSISAGIPTMAHVPLKALQGLELSASTGNKLDGKGASTADNNFTGTITVTVVEVMPNGNMIVSGEKQVAINQGDEFIRFSGVVNPSYISATNTVNSTQVADAHIEYRGSGTLDEAQKMGWLARFFQAVSPF